jgi:hypothetical protein
MGFLTAACPLAPSCLAEERVGVGVGVGLEVREEKVGWEAGWVVVMVVEVREEEG